MLRRSTWTTCTSSIVSSSWKSWPCRTRFAAPKATRSRRPSFWPELFLALGLRGRQALADQAPECHEIVASGPIVGQRGDFLRQVIDDGAGLGRHLQRIAELGQGFFLFLGDHSVEAR